MRTEPTYAHGQAPRTGVLLCNLGTPDAPTPAALRRYLAEFLSDVRVIEIPKPIWWFILHGIILRIRPAKSARKYASIWLPEGSPLRVWTEKQATLLAGYLGERGHRLHVRCAMRYGQPSISTVLDEMKAAGVTRVLVLPLYPHYSGPTTASVYDAVMGWAAKVRRLPEIRFVNHFHDDSGYIKALVKRVSDHWLKHGLPDRLVFSFHGVPQRTLLRGDPYHCECLKTGRLVGEALGLNPGQWLVTFQSRFGKAKWLQPYTEPTLIDMARKGVARVDLICPGFVADCLETLEEINMEARAAFIGAGGKEFNYLPCLNDQHEWIDALAYITLQHIQGWPTQSGTEQEVQNLAASKARALAAGAST